MKSIRYLILYILIIGGSTARAQKNYIHPTTLQLFYSISDFKNTTPFSGLSHGYGGLGVGYTKGINSRLDWKVQSNFLYGDSVMKRTQTFSSKELLIETDAAFRYRFLEPKVFLQPYVSTGVGFSIVKNYLGAYIYPGFGLQMNISTEAFLSLDVQRRFGLTTTLSNHYFYSIGLAGTIGKRKSSSKNNDIGSLSKNTLSIVLDRDKDGIVDSLDACPDNPGLAIFHGCPDSDQDGIPDNLDKCPTVPGFAKYNGCPIPDRDADGINDEEDQCPDVPGFARYHGCPIPDTDKDGVNDEEDSCITEPGPVELHGCPPISQEAIEKINLAAKNILFKTGSFELLSNSFSALDTVVAVMNKYPYLRLRIEGHTDNIGSAKTNQTLSENRANEIKNYLIQKGISQSRLTSLGFGEERPIASNNSSRGRATNRRVELHLYR